MNDRVKTDLTFAGIILVLLAAFLILSCQKKECYVPVNNHYYKCDDNNWIELTPIGDSIMKGVSINTYIESYRMWVFHNGKEEAVMYNNFTQCRNKKIKSSKWESGDTITVAIDTDATADEIILP